MNPGTKTTDRAEGRIRSCRKPPDPLRRMTAEPPRFSQSDGQGPVGLFCICTGDMGADNGRKQAGKLRTAEAAPGITILIQTNPTAPGGKQMNNELLVMLETIEQERGISKEQVV